MEDHPGRGNPKPTSVLVDGGGLEGASEREEGAPRLTGGRHTCSRDNQAASSDSLAVLSSRVKPRQESYLQLDGRGTAPRAAAAATTRPSLATSTSARIFGSAARLRSRVLADWSRIGSGVRSSGRRDGRRCVVPLRKGVPLVLTTHLTPLAGAK